MPGKMIPMSPQRKPTKKKPAKKKPMKGKPGKYGK